LHLGLQQLEPILSVCLPVDSVFTVPMDKLVPTALLFGRNLDYSDLDETD